MVLAEQIFKGSFLFGLTYLQGMVLYAWTMVDLRGDQANALAHYQSRKNHVSYKVVPVACICLTVGVFSNVWFRSADAVSLAQLAIAFGTVFNNGTNVVDPANSLKEQKGHEGEILSRVRKGHLVDILGFTALFAGLFF